MRGKNAKPIESFSQYAEVSINESMTISKENVKNDSNCSFDQFYVFFKAFDRF